MNDVFAAVSLVLVACSAGWLATAGWTWGRAPVAVFIGHTSMALGAYLGAYVGLNVLGAVLGAVALAVLGRRRPLEVGAPSHDYVRAVFVAASVIGVMFVVAAFLRRPEGWDTIAIWLTKARAIAFEGSYDHPVFHLGRYEYSHPDYPPLFPAWQSLVYSLGRGPYGAGLVVLLVSFNVSGMLTALALVAHRRLGATVVVGSFVVAPIVIDRIAFGAADLPAALFLLVGGLLLIDPERSRSWAALVLAAAALVRPDTPVLVLILLVVALADKELRSRAWPALVTIVAASVPWQLLMRSRGLHNDTIGPGALRPERLLEVVPDRLGLVLGRVSDQLLGTEQWGLALLVAVVAVAAFRVRPALLMASVLAFASLIVVYLITSKEPAWQIAATVRRIFLGPAALLVTAAVDGVLRGPREVTSRAASSPLGRRILTPPRERDQEAVDHPRTGIGAG